VSDEHHPVTLECHLAIANRAVPPVVVAYHPIGRQLRAAVTHLGKVTPSRATTRPRFTTVRRPGRRATASAAVSAPHQHQIAGAPLGQPIAFQPQRLRTASRDHIERQD
jgi:hypothetical protein